MQNITTLMTGLNLRQRTTQPLTAPVRENCSINDTVAKIFNHFFEGLKVIFPASIAVLKTAADIGQFKFQWIAAFAENNINSSTMINAGLRIARQQKSPFLPSVGQFIDWCQQGCAEDYGLPTPQQLCEKLQAYCRVRGHDDMQDFDYGSDANYWLVHDLYRAMIDRRLCVKELEDKAKELIGLLSQKLRNGYVVPKPRVAIEEHKTLKPTSSEKSLENIRKIKERFKFSRVKPSGRRSSTQPVIDELIHANSESITAHKVAQISRTPQIDGADFAEVVCNMIAVNSFEMTDTPKEKIKQINLLNENASSIVDEQKQDNAQSTIDNTIMRITEISDASDEMWVDGISDVLEQSCGNSQSALVRQNTDISQVMPENLIATQSRLSHPSKTHSKQPITLSKQFSISDAGKRILVYSKTRRINLRSEHKNMDHQTKQSIGNRIEFAMPAAEKTQKIITNRHTWQLKENRLAFDCHRLYCSRSGSDIRLRPPGGNHRHFSKLSSIRSSTAHKEVPNDILTKKLVST